MRVLVVEDHARLAETIATVLRRDGIAVDVAFDGREALARTAPTTYDVVVLDRDLPLVHGDEVCRTLAAGGYPGAVLMAPTTTCPSRSRSPSSSPASMRSRAVRAARVHRCSSRGTSCSTRRAGG